MDLTRDNLIKQLQHLDEDAALLINTTERLHLVLVGGGALVLQNYLSRATNDLDALNASQQLQPLVAKHGINSQVSAFVHNFPYNYEDRLVLVFEGKAIDAYAAALEDIVIAKLYANRLVDRSDIESHDVLVALDWGLLDLLAFDPQEARASALNDRVYSEFLANYLDSKERFGP